MSTARVWTQKATGFSYNGMEVEPGLVFNLQNQPRDEQLLRHDYLKLIGEGDDWDLTPCNGCGREFISRHHRDNHARRAQHEAVVVDGPQLKVPSKPLKAEISDGETFHALEPEGAPPPEPVAPGEQSVDMAARGVRPISQARR